MVIKFCRLMVLSSYSLCPCWFSSSSVGWESAVEISNNNCGIVCVSFKFLLQIFCSSVIWHVPLRFLCLFGGLTFLSLCNVPWTARRSSQSILKEISPEYSLEGLMLKLQYSGDLMQRTDSLEKTLKLGKIEGRIRRGWQRMRWLEGITDAMDMSASCPLHHPVPHPCSKQKSHKSQYPITDLQKHLKGFLSENRIQNS